MPIIPASNVQGTMGSAERFTPTSIQGQILPSYTLPYLLTPPGKAAVMGSNYDTSNLNPISIHSSILSIRILDLFSYISSSILFLLCKFQF